jgi:hypothetical protein
MLLYKSEYLTIRNVTFFNNTYKTGEPGGNKSGVDLSFGLCKGEIGRAVSEGMGELDVASAATIIRALHYKNVKVVAVAYQVLRENTTKLIEGKEIKDGRFQAHSFREYYYDENKRPTSACLYEQSLLKDVKAPMTIQLASIWKNSDYQYKGVIPETDMFKPLEMPITREYPIRSEPKTMDMMIKSSTETATSRVDKEAALRERKLMYADKKKSVQTAQFRQDNAKTEEIKQFAAEQGLQFKIPCPTKGDKRTVCMFPY